MEYERSLCTYLPKYKEYNCLISKYFNKKLNDNENLEDTMSKISPKFKTPIKYKTKFLTSKDNQQKIKCYKRPRYYIIDKIINNENDFDNNKYEKNTINLSKINNININGITRDNSFDNIFIRKPKYINNNPRNKNIYYKTPIKYRNKNNNKNSIRNLNTINTNNSTSTLNITESSDYRTRKKPEIYINKNKINNDEKFMSFGNIKNNSKIISNDYNSNKEDITKNKYKRNITKSYDNIIFKQKIKINKKKKRAKILRKKTYDLNLTKSSVKTYKKEKNKVNNIDISYNVRYQTFNKMENKNNNFNIVNKAKIIQKWWKSINQKRIENFNERFKRYKTIKNEKKSNIKVNFNHKKIFLNTQTKKENKINKGNTNSINKIGSISGNFFISKNNYFRQNYKLLYLQRKIKEYINQRKNNIKRPLMENLYITKGKPKMKRQSFYNYKIEHNFIHEIIPNKLCKINTINISFDKEKNNLEEIIYNNLPQKEVCYMTKINYKKYILLKQPLKNKFRLISKYNSIKNEEEYTSKPKKRICFITKNVFIKRDSLEQSIFKNDGFISKEDKIKNKNIPNIFIKKNIGNTIDDCSKSFSTVDNTTLKSKRSHFEEQNETNLFLKNNNIIMLKEYINKISEFILCLSQKINKNINQFVFYKIKYGKEFNIDENVFFKIIKRIINIYNNLSLNENQDEFFDILEFLKLNLAKNIDDYNKYKYISFIDKNSENNLINNQLCDINDYLLNFIIMIIKLEHNICIQNKKDNIIKKLFNYYKLKNRNIFTIMRCVDNLYEQYNKNKEQKENNEKIASSQNSIIKHNNIKSFYINPKFIRNDIIYNLRKNLISFSYLKFNPNIHVKYNSNKANDFEIINKIFFDKPQKSNIYYTITKINKFKSNNKSSSGEIDIFKKINNNDESNDKKEIINQIYDDYCFDKINKINFYSEMEEDNFDEEEEKIKRIRQVSKLSNESESEIINPIDCSQEDIIFNEIKECFNK